jgi:hypothetical protein
MGGAYRSPGRGGVGLRGLIKDIAFGLFGISVVGKNISDTNCIRRLHQGLDLLWM